MPTYCFKDNETKEERDYVLRISELDEFKEKNPHLTLVVQVSKFISGHALKPDNGFRSVLKGIKKANVRSNINTFE